MYAVPRTSGDQTTGADHLRWIMNNIDAEVCSQPEFSDCKLVLTVHDSLLFEVPDEKIVDFLVAIVPVARRRPQWASIDFEIEATVKQRFGDMQKVEV
jgi:DNA polymerase I-like protein with 3'-5' exonuclease and polymerase domains